MGLMAKRVFVDFGHGRDETVKDFLIEGDEGSDSLSDGHDRSIEERGSEARRRFRDCDVVVIICDERRPRRRRRRYRTKDQPGRGDRLLPAQEPRRQGVHDVGDSSSGRQDVQPDPVTHQAYDREGAVSQAPESDPAPEIIDLYKMAVEMADRVSARRGTSNSFFLSVQTAFVAVLGLAGSNLTKTLWASTAVALAGVALSVAWWLQLKSYRDLNRVKFEVINKIEEQLPVKIFSDEWAFLKRDSVRSWRTRYAELGMSERRVPFIFIVLHILLFVGRHLG